MARRKKITPITASRKISGESPNSVLDKGSSTIKMYVDLAQSQGMNLLDVVSKKSFRGVTKKEIDNLTKRMGRLEKNHPEDYNLLITSKEFKQDNLTGQKYAGIARSLGGGNFETGKKILDEMNYSKIEKFLLTTTPENREAILDVLITRTSMGYKRGMHKELSGDIVSDLSGDVKKPKSKKESRIPKRRGRPPKAPYGLKKDGTPKAKPGRKLKKPEEKLAEFVEEQFTPGFPMPDNLPEKIKENIIDGWIPYINDYNKENSDNPIVINGETKPKAEDVIEWLDYSPEQITHTEPPKKGEDPIEYLKDSFPTELEVTPEDIMKDKRLTDVEKKKAIEHLEDEEPDPEFIEWLQKKLRRRILPIPPDLEEQGLTPEEMLRQGAAHQSRKEKIATENWFKCAKIEFGLNIARLPVLLDLAYRCADIDPDLLFQPRTEINYWYNKFGWERCDELISNLEQVSGLRASEDIKGYDSVERRNQKIRRYYANKLRYNIREELKAAGWSDAELRRKEVARIMREKGYEY